MDVLNKIRRNVEPIVLGLGLNVWDILFEKEGKNKFLRVYIFKTDGLFVTLDDCEKVSLAVSKKLDEIDLIDERYFLEVSSVGTQRKLTQEKHFVNSIDKDVHVKLKKIYEGKRHLRGNLKAYEDGNIKIQTDDEVYTINLKDCLYVKLEDLKKI